MYLNVFPPVVAQFRKDGLMERSVLKGVDFELSKSHTSLSLCLPAGYESACKSSATAKVLC